MTTITPSSLKKGGDLWVALVGNNTCHGQQSARFYHPLFVGRCFVLEPSASSLKVLTCRTIDLPSMGSNGCNEAAQSPSPLSRGGLIYQACLRAGRSFEWGPLKSDVIYHAWAVADERNTNRDDEVISKAFALRKPVSGTVALVYKSELDRLVLHVTGSRRPNVAANAIKVSLGGKKCKGDEDMTGTSPPILTAAEIRAKRLERLGQAPAAAPALLTVPLPVSARAENQPAENEMALRIIVEPQDNTNVLAGGTVILEAKAVTTTTENISYQWFFSTETIKISCGIDPDTKIVGANRCNLRIDPFGITQEGYYWCVATAISEMSCNDDRGGVVMETKTRVAKVYFSPFDRFLLGRIDSVMKFAESAFLVEQNRDSKYSFQKMVQVINLIQNVLNLSRESDPNKNLKHTNNKNPSHKYYSEKFLKSRCQHMADQLPSEISTLLTMKAQAHFICASSSSSNIGSTSVDSVHDTDLKHYEQARRDSSAALRMVPGDRDALRIHAKSSEGCGRLSEAIESLEMLQRLTTSSSSCRKSYDENLQLLRAKLEEERRVYREAAAASRQGENFARKFGTRGSYQYNVNHDGVDDETPDEGDTCNREEEDRSSPRNASDPQQEPFRGYTQNTSRNQKYNQKPGGSRRSSRQNRPQKKGANSALRRRPWQEIHLQQEEEWHSFALASTPITGPNDIPWPDETLTGFTFVGVTDTATRQEKRQAVKRCLLRWHPDKFTQRLSSRFVSAEVFASCEDRVLGVARRLTELTENIT